MIWPLVFTILIKSAQQYVQACAVSPPLEIRNCKKSWNCCGLPGLPIQDLGTWVVWARRIGAPIELAAAIDERCDGRRDNIGPMPDWDPLCWQTSCNGNTNAWPHWGHCHRLDETKFPWEFVVPSPAWREGAPAWPTFLGYCVHLFTVKKQKRCVKWF